MLGVISIVFTVLVSIYLMVFLKRLNYLDVIMIALSLLVLILSTFRHHGHIEFFAAEEDGASKEEEKSLIDLSTLSLQEDPKPITKHTVVYVTAFNDKSYPGTGKELYNLSFNPKQADTCPSGTSRVFAFETNPSFSLASGFGMNTNRLIGPLSNTLGIDLQSTFSIFFTCRHNVFVNNPKEEIEFFKLYANSSNNNGIVMFIPSGGVTVGADTQTARLNVLYIDEDMKECSVAMSPNITFPTTNFMSYYVVKDVDTLKVYCMNGNSPNAVTLLSTSILPTKANFSNKELIINRFNNYRGNIYQFGIVPRALTIDEVSQIHTHSLDYHTKFNSEDFMRMTKNYNEMVEYLNKMKGCPYDKDVCAKCETITDWTNNSQLVTASADCRKAIDDFCNKNQTHFRCRCWNKTLTSEYNSTSCKLWRGIFMPDKKAYDNLSQDEINYIQNKYALVKPEDCPKPAVTPEKSCINENLAKNTYMPYDYNKIKIDPKSLSNSSTRPSSVMSPYNGDAEGKSPLRDKDNKETRVLSSATSPLREKRSNPTVQPVANNGSEFRPIDPNVSTNISNASKDHAYRVAAPSVKVDDKQETEDIENIYQTDPNIKFDQSANVAFAELEKTKKLESSGPSPFMDALNNVFFGGL